MYKVQYEDDHPNEERDNREDDDDDQELKRTDLVDYVVLNGLGNIHRTLNINTSEDDYTSDLVRHCLFMLRGYPVECQGPMGIVTFLEKSSSLCFGKLLGIHLLVDGVDREREMRNVLVDEIWQQVEATERKITTYLPKHRLTNDLVFRETVNLFKKALRARKPVFIYSHISLYERAVVLANAWLMIYNFVYFAVKRIDEDMDFYGRSIVKLLSLYNNNGNICPFLSLTQDDCFREFNALVNNNHEIYIDVQMKVDTFETVTNEVLAKEYRTLNLVSPHDRRLEISPFIRKDLILCIHSQFQELDQRLQRRRDELRLPLRTCHLPRGKNYCPPAIDTERIKINREIRIADTDNSCTYPPSKPAASSRNIAYIYQKSIATTPLNYTLKCAGNESDIQDIICDELWNSYRENYGDQNDIENIFMGDEEEEDLGEFLNGCSEDCEYDVDYIEHIKKKMSRSTNGGKTFRRAYMGYLTVWEDLGPLLLNIEPDDATIRNLEMNEISERIREAMAIDDMSRGISHLNRFEVRFSGSKYTLSNRGKIKYNSHTTNNNNIRACKLYHIPVESEFGVHPIYKAGKKPTKTSVLYCPSPLDVVYGIMFHLVLGNSSIDLKRDFMTLQQFTSAIWKINGEKKRIYHSRVLTIPPTRITRLEIDQSTTKCIEGIIEQLLKIYGYDSTRLWCFEYALRQLCELENEDVRKMLKRKSTTFSSSSSSSSSLFNRLIQQMLAVDVSSYELATHPFRLIVPNALAAMSFMKTAIHNVYSGRWLKCDIF